MCYVSDQIAEYCNNDIETYCDECGSTMTKKYKHLEGYFLECDKCDNVINLEEEF